MKKILITGGAGYIGSILSTKLVELGHHVTVVDLLKYSTSSLNHLYNSKNFEFIHADVMNKKIMKKLISKNEYIIPLAGLVGAPLCEKYKKDAIDVNYKAKCDAMHDEKKRKKDQLEQDNAQERREDFKLSMALARADKQTKKEYADMKHRQKLLDELHEE